MVMIMDRHMNPRSFFASNTPLLRMRDPECQLCVTHNAPFARAACHCGASTLLLALAGPHLLTSSPQSSIARNTCGLGAQHVALEAQRHRC